jgi:hypothetical protein
MKTFIRRLEQQQHIFIRGKLTIRNLKKKEREEMGEGVTKILEMEREEIMKIKGVI